MLSEAAKDPFISAFGSFKTWLVYHDFFTKFCTSDYFAPEGYLNKLLLLSACFFVFFQLSWFSTEGQRVLSHISLINFFTENQIMSKIPQKIHGSFAYFTTLKWLIGKANKSRLSVQGFYLIFCEKPSSMLIQSSNIFNEITSFLYFPTSLYKLDVEKYMEMIFSRSLMTTSS